MNTKRLRPTVALIDEASFLNNLRVVRRRVGASARIMAVVKANAYGHGAVQLGRAAVAGEADFLGVATLEEALELRDARITSPILVFGVPVSTHAELALHNDVRLVVPCLEIAESLNAVARSLGTRAKVHIKVDTGMGRIGFWHEDIDDATTALERLDHLDVEGMMTHFPESDCTDKAFTQWQTKRFSEIRTFVESKGIRIPIYHAANSGGVLDHPESHFDMVRPGIMLYGLHPSDECGRESDLRPVMTLKTEIVFLKSVPKGRSISYARTFCTQRPSLIATLPIGYADGISRTLSGRGIVSVRGRRVPIVGRVTMDQIMIDVTEVPEVHVGDEVIIFGSSEAGAVSAEEVARTAGTIPYEVVCWVSARVPRVPI